MIAQELSDVFRRRHVDFQVLPLSDRHFRPTGVDTPSGEPYHPDMGPISETYRYIVRSAGVRGGSAVVEGTRIAVHDVIGLLQNGETVDTLRENCFPQLSRSQVYECLAYYEDHRGEIDLLVAKQMAPASE
jgi:uncharacterized protein (DUF433 family)